MKTAAAATLVAGMTLPAFAKAACDVPVAEWLPREARPTSMKMNLSWLHICLLLAPLVGAVCLMAIASGSVVAHAPRALSGHASAGQHRFAAEHIGRQRHL